MEANIQYINVYNDGLIEMIVICNSCKKQNVHTITHLSLIHISEPTRPY